MSIVFNKKVYRNFYDGANSFSAKKIYADFYDFDFLASDIYIIM
jgi:hypothetical protein